MLPGNTVPKGLLSIVFTKYDHGQLYHLLHVKYDRGQLLPIGVLAADPHRVQQVSSRQQRVWAVF